MGLTEVASQTEENSEVGPSIDTESDKIQVVGYVRVSTEKQKEEESHVKQRESIEKWAERTLEDGYELEIIEDLAISGQSDDREGYNSMMDNLEDIDMIVVRELSRFGRSLKRIIKDIENLESKGVDFVSIKDSEINTSSAQGKLLFHIIAAFNQFWSDLAQERSEEMIERRREEGKPIGRPRKLSDKQIKELYEIRMSEGYSYATLKAVAESKGYVDEISRATIRRNMRKVERGDIEI
jgi:DNA invertase Pin-like site-specific DNA recombinase